jgi:hypothetical protein
VLMEMSRELGFPRTVPFTCYGLLNRLGWRDDRDSYEMLKDAFERLSGVMINTRNVHWNEKAQCFYNSGFGLIQSYLISAERPGRKKLSEARTPQSHFIWNEFVHESITSGSIRTVDLDFALSLAKPVSLRLYRYLDKKAHDGKESFEIEVHRLCEMHLGMTPAPYISALKQRLKPAHDELRDRGFLVEVTYAPMRTRKGEKICYTFASRKCQAAEAVAPTVAAETAPAASTSPRSKAAKPVAPLSLEEAASREEQQALQAQDAAQAPTEPMDSAREDLLARLAAIKVSAEVARELVENTASEALHLQLDCLSDREPRNAAAVLVKAVREGWEPPAKYLERQQAAERVLEAQTTLASSQALEASQKAAERAQRASQDLEATELDTRWEQLGPADREIIEAEALKRLGILARGGRAQAALAAMRRTLMREGLLPV